MNALTVVLILFGAAFLAAVLLAVFNKKHRRTWIASSVALVPMALVAVLVVNVTFSALPETVSENSYPVETVSEKGYLDMAFALISRGETAGAEKLLDEYALEYPVTDRYMLARARMEAVRKNYSQADGIYSYLEKNSDVDKDSIAPEHNEVTLLMKGSGTYEKLTELILKDIKAFGIPEEAMTAARLYSEVDAMDQSGMYKEMAKESAEKYKTCLEGFPYLFSSSTMELSYLKALTVAEDYKEIVNRSNKYTDSHSLLILAELCRMNKIKGSVLAESDINNKIKNRNTRMYDWISAQDSSNDFGEKQEVVDSAKSMLEQSDISTPKQYKAWVSSQLLALAEGGGEKEASKLYLELARLDYTENGGSSNDDYIRKALLTAGNSEDEAYASSAAAINAILEDKNNTESLKSIDGYVDQLIENMGAEEMSPGFGTDLSYEDRLFADQIMNELYPESSEPSEGEAPESVIMPMVRRDSGEPRVGLVDYEYDSESNYSSSDSTSEQKAFSSYVTAQVNQITASINIASVDASEFDKVSLVVAVDDSIADNAEKFKSAIDIYDCGVLIKDYTVEKIEDEKFNIVLVCDNSGSMGDYDKIGNLKSALNVFVNNLSSDVRVGIVSFDSSIIQKCCCPLGSDADTLRDTISKMGAYGGTDIRDGVYEGINRVNPGEGLNVLIVMSDGQDSMPSDSTLSEIKKACAEKDILIYSMGLGSDVDSQVLSAYSNAGGGSYTYVSDANALLSFYQYLYGVSRNRYKVTYNAQDTMLVSRKAMAVYKSDAKVSDTMKYSINDGSPTQTDLDEDDLGEDYEIPLNGLTVSGFDTRLIYRSSSDQIIHLLGQGLVKDTELTVSITSGMSYELKCEYESDTSWKVTIPSDTACGEYDVIVTVNGRRCVFTSGFVVSSNKTSVIRFGDYVFEASNVMHFDNEVRLTGFVRMNNWLGFSGGVSLRGNLATDSSIVLSASNAYVCYQKNTQGLNAFAMLMSETGTMITIPSISELTLYRNSGISPSSDEFRTDAAYAGMGLLVQNLFELNTPGIRLYPDRLEVNFNEFTSKFPMQDQILKATSLDKLFEFNVGHQETLVVSEKAVDCKVEIKAASSDDKLYSPLKFGNMDIYANLNDFELKIDTQNADYSIKLAVNIAMLGNGLGLELGWKGGKFDTAKIYADFDINTTISGVPVTFSDFSLGITDVADQGVAGMTLVGGCKISVMKVSEYLPGVEKYIGDVSILSLEDTTLSLSLGHKYISLSTKLKLLELAELGQASIKLGLEIPYTNTLIGYDGESVMGFVGSFNLGPKFESDNCTIEISGGGEVALTNRVIGLTASGKVKYELKWWIFSAGDVSNGKAFIGMYQKHNGEYVFAFIAGLNGNDPFVAEWNPKAVIA